MYKTKSYKSTSNENIIGLSTFSVKKRWPDGAICEGTRAGSPRR